MSERFTTDFPGCSPKPLSNYLKALGLFRVVATQLDSKALANWTEANGFSINCSADTEAVIEFLLKSYSPSPVLDPWNAGSGFYKKDNGKTTKNILILEEILASDAGRLESLKTILNMTSNILSGLGYHSAPSDKEKARLISSLRSSLPDSALDWFDASVVMAGEEPSYPALLGTGGNDGNLDFANNFYQRLAEVFSFKDGSPSPLSRGWLRSAIFGEPVSGLARNVAMGQFNPGMTGGVNATAGFSDQSVVNPWEYILMIEGVLVFSAAVVRRFESGEVTRFSFPFTVRPSKAGYSGSSDFDKARAEMWFPLWRSPADYREISYLFSEGRATVGRRTARNSIDFAIATASIGVDRGISDFERYSFMVRNGKSYFAAPLGRFTVHDVPDADILEEINDWQRRVPSNDSGAVSSAISSLNSRIMQFCRTGERSGLLRVLVEAGKAQQALARSGIPSKSGFVTPPLHLFDPRWAAKTYDGSAEFRLAASLASSWVNGMGGIRQFFDPVSSQSGKMAFNTDSKLFAGRHPDPVSEMNAVLKKILVVSTQKGNRKYPVRGALCSSPSDISRFIQGSISFPRFGELLKGLLLLHWNEGMLEVPWKQESSNAIPAPWAVIKLVHTSHRVGEKDSPFDLAIHRMAASGNLAAAVKKAAARLHADGLTTPVRTGSADQARARRMVSALLFPVSSGTIRSMKKLVSTQEEKSPGRSDINENNE